MRNIQAHAYTQTHTHTYTTSPLELLLKRWYTENELRYSDIDIISKRKWTSLSRVQHGLSSPSNSPGLNTGLGSLSLLQGIFPTQRLNPGFPPCRWILCKLRYQGGIRILEWIVYPFSSRSSQPRNRIRVSCIAGWFCTNWAIKEVLNSQSTRNKGKIKKQTNHSKLKDQENFPEGTSN